MKNQEIKNLIKDNLCEIDLLGEVESYYTLQVTDLSSSFIPEDERVFYDVYISLEDLYYYLNAAGECDKVDDYFDVEHGHTQIETKINPEDILITEDIIKQYILNNNNFKTL